MGFGGVIEGLMGLAVFGISAGIEYVVESPGGSSRSLILRASLEGVDRNLVGYVGRWLFTLNLYHAGNLADTLIRGSVLEYLLSCPRNQAAPDNWKKPRKLRYASF